MKKERCLLCSWLQRNQLKFIFFSRGRSWNTDPFTLNLNKSPLKIVWFCTTVSKTALPGNLTYNVKCRNFLNQIIHVMHSLLQNYNSLEVKKCIIFQRQLWKYGNTKTERISNLLHKRCQNMSQNTNNYYTGPKVWFLEVFLKSELGTTLNDASTHSVCPEHVWGNSSSP